MPIGKKGSSGQQRYLAEYCRSATPEVQETIVQLDKLIRKWQPRLPAEIWHSMGFPIIGYGKATYRSGGKQRQWFIVGLAAHRSYFSLYVWGVWKGGYLLEAYANRLGQVKTGKACLNFKAIADLDLAELRKLVDKAVALQTTEEKSSNT